MKPAKATTDLVRTYLKEIGRFPLLTREQEILYGKQVQRLIALQSVRNSLEEHLGYNPSLAEWAEKANLTIGDLQLAVRNCKHKCLKPQTRHF